MSKVFEYKVDQGDGRWLLNENGKTMLSTPGTEIAFCYDRENGTRHKHGDPAIVKAWLDDKSAKFRQAGFDAMADDLVMISGHSLPLIGEPKAGTIYFTEEDVNRCLSCTGAILKIAEKVLVNANTLDVEVTVISDSPSA